MNLLFGPLLAIGAIAMGLFTNFAPKKFHFPVFVPEEIPPMDPKKRARLPKLVREFLDKYEGELARTKAAYDVLKEKTTAEIARLEDAREKIQLSLMGERQGRPGVIRIEQSYDYTVKAGPGGPPRNFTAQVVLNKKVVLRAPGAPESYLPVVVGHGADPQLALADLERKIGAALLSSDILKPDPEVEEVRKAFDFTDEDTQKMLAALDEDKRRVLSRAISRHLARRMDGERP